MIIQTGFPKAQNSSDMVYLQRKRSDTNDPVTGWKISLILLINYLFHNCN